MSNEEGLPTEGSPDDTNEQVTATRSGIPEANASESGPPRDGDPPAADTGGDPVTEERDRLKQQLMRVAADFDNFRRRSKREIQEAQMRGKDEAVLEMLPIMDNLERAVQASAGAEDVAAVVSGVQMVLKLFEDTASRMGLNRVKSVGERFDPAVHDAIQQQETDAQPPGTIIAEVAAGYMFGKRLIRPAMVVVARAPRPANPAPSDPPAAQTASASDPAPGAEAQAVTSEDSGADE